MGVEFAKAVATGRRKPANTITDYVEVSCPFCKGNHVHTVHKGAKASGLRVSHCGLKEGGYYHLSE